MADDQCTPARRAASIIAAQSSSVSAIGFSISRCLPAPGRQHGMLGDGYWCGVAT